MSEYLYLINEFVQSGVLKTPQIIEAFKKINRADFLPPDLKEEAGLDAALPLFSGQTISQPQVVALMMELLAPEPGDKILDVGAGSGWTSALLAWCVSQDTTAEQHRGYRTGSPRPTKCGARDDGVNGKVFSLEIVPKLCEFGKNNVSRYNFIEKSRVQFLCQDGSGGLLNEAPFDKILVSAAAEEIPEALKKQLKIGGRLVLPVKNSIWLVIRKTGRDFEEKEFKGFVFVPLVSQQ